MRLDLGESLSEVRAKALSTIDRQAEAARLRYVTPGAGQAMEYTATEAEARRWVTGESLAGYPFLAAEANAMAAVSGTAPEPAALVTIVLAQAALWAEFGSAIKQIRREAKMAVQVATTVAQIRAILAGLVWP